MKPWLTIKPGKIDVLVGLLIDAPPSGCRTSLYTQPLFASSFGLSALPYSSARLFGGDGISDDNAASTAALIDRFEAEVDLIMNDGSYAEYQRYLARLFEGSVVDHVDYICLTKAYLYVNVGDVAAARNQLTAFAYSSGGSGGDRLNASADRLREALDRSLADAKAIVQAIVDHNRQAIGLPIGS